jgi:hypothetical protein
MFFGDQDTQIVDICTLERVVGKADGDITYVSRLLSDYGRVADENMQISTVQCRVGDTIVSYQGVGLKNLVAFGQHKYKSEGIDERIAKEFIADGGHPYDVLGGP